MRYLFLPLAVFLLTVLPLSGEKQGVSIFVNGRYVGQGDVRNGKTFVPLRLVSESLGAEVSLRYDEDPFEAALNNRRTSFKGIDISLVANPGESSGPGKEPLRRYEGAWDPPKTDAFLLKVEAWFSKTEVLLSLFDPSTVTVSGDLGKEYTQAIRNRFRSVKAHLEASKKGLAALRRNRYMLVLFDSMIESLMSLGNDLGELGRLDEIPGITGAPSSELAIGYINQSTAASNLLLEVSQHQQALLLWYQTTAGTPNW